MSQVRLNTLQSLDNTVTIDIKDILTEGALSSPTGAEEVGFERGTVAEALDGNLFKKSVALSLPFQFSGYSTVLAALGGTYLYPQGADYDDDGNLFINYITDNGAATQRAMVVYSPTGVELTWFYIGTSSGQSVTVVGGNGNRRLYERRLGDDVVYYYQLNALPATGSTVSVFTATAISGSGSHMAIEGNILVTVQNAVPIGNTANEMVINTYNLSTGAKLGSLTMSRALTGFGTPSISPSYYYLSWKIQGISVHNGNILVAVGGSYRPGFDTASNPVHDTGVVVISPSGKILTHNVVTADGLMTGLSSLGFPVSRTESEGVFRHPSGEYHSIIIGDMALPTPSTPNGIVILREFDKTGTDFTQYKSGYLVKDYLDFTRLMRAESGLFKNPFTNTTFTSITEILDLMSYFNIHEFNWGAAAAPSLTTIPGFTYVNSQFYSVLNVNNIAFIITESGAAGTKVYNVTGTVGSWTATRTNVRGSELVMDDNGGIARTSFAASTGTRLNVLQQNYTGTSSPLVIGGGVSGRHASNNIFFYTDSTVTNTTGGANTFTVTPTAITPGTDGGSTNGTASLRWGTIFSTSATISTSDANKKNVIGSVDDALMRIGSKLAFKLFTYKDSKNEIPRKHAGLIAQEVISLFESEGLDAFEYGAVCYDSWEDAYRDVYESRILEDGSEVLTKVGEERYIEAGELYSLRYEELYAMALSSIINRLELLEAKLNG